MIFSKPSQPVLWNTVLVVFVSFLTLAGCIIEDFPLDNRKCNSDSKCLEGWYCDSVRKICLKGTGTVKPEPSVEPPKERSKPEVAPEPSREEVPRESVDAGPDDGGSGDVVPDNPGVLKCSFSRPGSNVECPTPPSAGCNRFSETFKSSSVALPTALVGAAATATPDVFSIVVDTTGQKKFVYLLGGGPKGVAGDKVLVAEVKDDGTLVEWKSGPALKTARVGASAFWIRGRVFVLGGVDSTGAPVKSVEQAVVKADGSLEAFKEVGTWSSARAQAGIAYRHGYFYLAGGTSNATLSTTVERMLLKPDGTLGNVEVQEPLSEGRTGPLVSTDRALFLLGMNGSKRILVSPLQSDGKPGPWCQSSALPPELVSFAALSDVSRLFLAGVKTTTKLDNRVFFGVLEKGKDKVADIGGLSSWYCSDHQTPANKALLLTPRSRAAAVFVGSYLYVFGGEDSAGKPLSSVEYGKLEYRKDGRCDLDLDGKTNSFDFCPHVPDEKNRNSDKPKKADGGELTSPRDPQWSALDVERFLAGDVCESDTMVFVPAGRFTRGSSTNSDEPQGQITVDGFFVDKVEVTNKDYAACVRLGKCTEPSSKKVGDIADYYGNKSYDAHPVVNITWAQAKAYCAFRGKRLLTEAEWEKAARALAGAAYPWGNIAPDCKRSHFQDCKLKSPQPAGGLPAGASPYGVLDMSGNVREWVSDFYSATAYKDGPAKNPTGPASGTTRVVRGGSYLSPDTGIRSSRRDQLKPGESKEDLGFRCATGQFPAVAGP